MADITRIDLPRPDLPPHLTASPDEPICCHYVAGEECVLFGTGYAFSAAHLLDALDDLGGVDTVVVEHADTDHYGALPQVVERYEPAVIVPEDDRGFLPRTYDLAADRLLAGGDEVAGFQAVTVRGHTYGNLAFVDEEHGLLVAGDTVVGSDSDIAAPGRWSGPLAPPAARFNRDDERARENLVALADRAVKDILLTHGDDVFGGGTNAVDRLLGDLGLHWER